MRKRSLVVVLLLLAACGFVYATGGGETDISKFPARPDHGPRPVGGRRRLGPGLPHRRGGVPEVCERAEPADQERPRGGRRDGHRRVHGPRQARRVRRPDLGRRSDHQDPRVQGRLLGGGLQTGHPADLQLHLHPGAGEFPVQDPQGLRRLRQGEPGQGHDGSRRHRRRRPPRVDPLLQEGGDRGHLRPLHRRRSRGDGAASPARRWSA